LPAHFRDGSQLRGREGQGQDITLGPDHLPRLVR
jgi:hypothetical protein